MLQLIEELKNIKLAIFDLDGVIYRGDTLISGVDKIIQGLKDLSIEVIYNSNNSTATRQMYVDRLKKFNISTQINDFFTSASITATEITKLKKNAKIFVIGEIGLEEELKAQGHIIITNKLYHNEIDFVIVGLDRDFNYSKLAFAQKCILDGKAQFYATNSDATLPVAEGLLPGAGVMVNALVTCTGVKPVKIFGKPQPTGIQLILNSREMKPENVVIFGDRLDTDIVAGNLAGIKTVLVLTGVTSKEDITQLESRVSSNQNLIPHIIIENLNEIYKN